jgi:hypothetical protein
MSIIENIKECLSEGIVSRYMTVKIPTEEFNSCKAKLMGMSPIIGIAFMQVTSVTPSADENAMETIQTDIIEIDIDYLSQSSDSKKAYVKTLTGIDSDELEDMFIHIYH